MCNGSAALCVRAFGCAVCIYIPICPRLIQSRVQSLSLSLLWRRRSSAAGDGLVVWEQARRRAGVHVVPVRGEGGEHVPAVLRLRQCQDAGLSYADPPGRLWRPLFLLLTVDSSCRWRVLLIFRFPFWGFHGFFWGRDSEIVRGRQTRRATVLHAPGAAAAAWSEWG
jgi:hypothetical protein